MKELEGVQEKLKYSLNAQEYNFLKDMQTKLPKIEVWI